MSEMTTLDAETELAAWLYAYRNRNIDEVLEEQRGIFMGLMQAPNWSGVFEALGWEGGSPLSQVVRLQGLLAAQRAKIKQLETTNAMYAKRIEKQENDLDQERRNHVASVGQLERLRTEPMVAPDGEETPGDTVGDKLHAAVARVMRWDRIRWPRYLEKAVEDYRRERGWLIDSEGEGSDDTRVEVTKEEA